MYRTPDGEAISVFRPEGDADVRDLGDGTISSSAGGDMWSAPHVDAHVVVIDGTGYVWVVISDQPHDDMMGDMMETLPGCSPSIGDRLRDVAAAVEPFRVRVRG